MPAFFSCLLYFPENTTPYITHPTTLPATTLLLSHLDGSRAYDGGHILAETDVQTGDDLFESCWVLISEVLEEPLSGADHLDEAASGRVILWIGLCVLGQHFDLDCEFGDLCLWGATIVVMESGLCDGFGDSLLENSLVERSQGLDISIDCGVLHNQGGSSRLLEDRSALDQRASLDAAPNLNRSGGHTYKSQGIHLSKLYLFPKTGGRYKTMNSTNQRLRAYCKNFDRLIM